MKPSRHKILEKTVFLIGSGLFALLIWYFIKDSVTQFNESVLAGYSHNPNHFLWLNFFYWLTLLSAVGCLILGTAGVIRLLVFKD